jgi:hypothetical protein
MLAKVVFDKTVFVKLKIQNNKKSIGKSISSLWILKISGKIPRTKSLETFSKSLCFPIKNP